MNKKGSFKPVIIALIISMLIALFWNSLVFLKNFVHAILNPTAGALISWNLHIGMLLIVFILTLITTLIQKYGTDQEALKELKKVQKEAQKEMRECRDDPKKLMELQKKSFESLPQTFKLSMRSFAYTAIPLLLFFRWFMDFFQSINNPKFFGFLGWFLFYLLFSIIFSSILRKALKVA
jgi:uncharacterized membrane protein (DUF106 family)